MSSGRRKVMATVGALVVAFAGFEYVGFVLETHRFDVLHPARISYCGRHYLPGRTFSDDHQLRADLPFASLERVRSIPRPIGLPVYRPKLVTTALTPCPAMIVLKRPWGSDTEYVLSGGP